MKITGKVSKIDKDLFDKSYMTFETSAYLDLVRVYFKSSEIPKLGYLNNGQTITIVGRCEGKSVVYIEINDTFFK